LNKGVVSLHMVKSTPDSELGNQFVYKYLAIDVKGHQRIYLENADASLDSPAKSKTKIFGVSWR
jgi:import inner membrane translocase subunit TIM21